MSVRVHPTADVQSNKIGMYTQIWQGCIVLPEAVIGNNCNINCHCFIENDVVIGNNVTLKSGVYVWDGIVLEDDVFIGPNVTFTNDIRPRSKRRPDAFKKTLIKKGASIGAGSVIIGGIVIGEYAMIGAGSVVTKDIPANTLWYGNPARHKGYVCSCGESLNKQFVCGGCGSRYKVNNERLMVY